jgi:two-component system, response regulator
VKSKTVLLVEDNPDDVGLTLRAIRKNHVECDVVIARDGVEALQLLGVGVPPDEAPAQLPALILLDLKLPKLDGLQLLRQMRADSRTRLIPVVILTSSKEEGDIIDGYSLGANSYIRKPVDFAEFVEVVRQMGLYWLVLNETPPLMRRR